MQTQIMMKIVLILILFPSSQCQSLHSNAIFAIKDTKEKECWTNTLKKHPLRFEGNCPPTLEENFCGKSSKKRVKSLPPVKKPPSIKQLKEDREVKTMKENRKPMSLPSLDSIIDKYCIDMVKIDSKSKMNNFKTPFKGGNCYPEQETSETQSDKILEESSSRLEDGSCHSLELLYL